MGDVVYRSHVAIERGAGGLRHVTIPYVDHAVLFGTHSEVAEPYGREPGTFEPPATTLDYVGAAAAG